MSETRYIVKYTYPAGLTPEEKIPANAIIEQIPYEVSDEQLALEQERQTCQEYLSHSPAAITQPQMWFLIRAFGKMLGFFTG